MPSSNQASVMAVRKSSSRRVSGKKSDAKAPERGVVVTCGNTMIPTAKIQSMIISMGGVQVMLDRDLARLYGVDVKRLNQQVNRNIERFPERFMHQLTNEEFSNLKSQIATSSSEDGIAHLKSQFATSSWGGVKIELITHSNGELAESDFTAFAKQCGHFTKTLCGVCHDRFIIADQKELFVIGASLKDAGRLTFAASKLGAEMIPGLLASLHKAASKRTEYGTK